MSCSPEYPTRLSPGAWESSLPRSCDEALVAQTGAAPELLSLLQSKELGSQTTSAGEHVMSTKGPLLQPRTHVREVTLENAPEIASGVVATRDHALIRCWAAARQAEPATGEATRTGPSTVNVNDGGAGIRFNFPGAAVFRPITWEEWFENFDHHRLAFVFEQDRDDAAPSARYRLVKADDWTDPISTAKRHEPPRAISRKRGIKRTLLRALRRTDE
jgi:hypothetical protein